MEDSTEKITSTGDGDQAKANEKQRQMDFGWSCRVTEKLIQTNDEEELKRRGYLLGKTLGEGSYAKVKAGFDQNRRQKCALKIVNRRKAPKEFQNKFLPRELAVLKKVKHPHIITLHEIIVFGDKIVLVLELAGHGDLLEFVKLRGKLEEKNARRIFAQIVAAVDYLHKRNVVHRDLKCENILLDRENNVKVSDFGFCKELLKAGAVSCTFCGSSAYASPEILQGQPYCAKAADVWSLGIILYIMTCGTMPFDDASIKRLVKDQTEQKLEFATSFGLRPSNQLVSLIRWMLQPTVKQRPTIKDVKHSFWMVLGQMEATKSAAVTQTGSRTAPPPQTGSRTAPPPQTGSRTAPPPQTGSRTAPPPQTGSRTAPPPQTGSRTASSPQTGSRTAPPPQAGSRTAPSPQTGSRTAPPPQTGSRTASPPKTGSRTAPSPQTGSRTAPLSQTGGHATDKTKTGKDGHNHATCDAGGKPKRGSGADSKGKEKGK